MYNRMKHDKYIGGQLLGYRATLIEKNNRIRALENDLIAMESYYLDTIETFKQQIARIMDYASAQERVLEDCAYVQGVTLEGLLENVEMYRKKI